ncbi:hypothetical protein HDIA_1327 [Hartmannibacter diazotrophicus]|uniref:DUF2336 domain-containing protein n=1 Tax=Hartmannibacter diazotrophicus TaxID=1482074 RepID=A0A2C9D3Y0_9HYPH|nr:DUF2336 domain-containing protein [Hartmannibacter diazotrophicus]SON54868.1 hypothetical protein HDIA_1327 [Hartmannibacter diazotrophicus]
MTQQTSFRDSRGAIGSRDETSSSSLLLTAAELFVSENEHTAEEIRIFEELVLPLLRTTGPAERAKVARRLGRHPDLPQIVARALLFAEPEVAAILLAVAPDLAEIDLLALCSSGSMPHLHALAGRRKLPASVVDSLCERLDNRGRLILASNESQRLTRKAIPLLVHEARDNPDLANALAARIDVEDQDLIPLFLDLDDRGRRRIHRALEILALRDFASHRPAPRPPILTRAFLQDLGRAAARHDMGALAMMLGDHLELDADYVRDLLVDRGGEPLTVALKAAGLDEAAATRIILFSGSADHRSYFEVRALVDLYNQITLRAASQLLHLWHEAGLKRASVPQALPSHQPLSEAGSPVHRPAAAQAPSLPAASTERPGLAPFRRLG